MTDPGGGSGGTDGAPTGASIRSARGATAGPPAILRGHAIRELPAAERPRERLAQRGPAGLTAAELIALL